MTWVAVAVAGSAVLGAYSSNKASKAQGASAQLGIGETARQYDQTREDQMPWLRSGQAANQTLAYRLGLGPAPGGPAPIRPDQADYMTKEYTPYGSRYVPRGNNIPGGVNVRDVLDNAGYRTAMDQYESDLGAYGRDPENYGDLLDPYNFEEDPGHQFALAEGEKAIDRMSPLSTGRDSGATMKGLLRFNTDYADTKYGQGFSRDLARRNNIYNMLAGISGTGQVAAQNLGVTGANAANNISNLMTQGGNARAAGIVGGANAWNDAISSGLQWNQNQNMMNWLNSSNNSSGGLAKNSKGQTYNPNFQPGGGSGLRM